SPVANASGPHVSDPRTGEILESHINWYHNVMELLRNWYFIQCSATDPRARTMQFSDSLMGDLIRFVSSHEVGHTLGLRHNFGASTAYPVEKLRDREWVRKNGIAPSIMDYARFNYVAQPEDSMTGSDFYPRINYYDNWAIEWGYRILPDAATPEAEKPLLAKWIVEKLKDRKYFFGSETETNDPRDQSEDLGDDAMKASMYGIRNLQRIVPNLLRWTYQSNEDYSTLNDIYREVRTQFMRYMGHVVTNIGGTYNTPKMVEEAGPQTREVPKQVQKEALRFLQQQLFATPYWMLDTAVMARTYSNPVDIVRQLQASLLGYLLSADLLIHLDNADAATGGKGYSPLEFLGDMKKGIWAELYTHKPIDIYRRNLQKLYVKYMIALVKPAADNNPFRANTTDVDASSIARAHLAALKKDILSAAALAQDDMTRYHLQDLVVRITQTLEPK
ncbi:MAG: zinc-dependent metalloprotease, partial [Bacteroidetes bacterium]|nr:zinc-dependent metalloprotease [Bacteroidota bacterium]